MVRWGCVLGMPTGWVNSDRIILLTLAAAGVLTIALFSIKGILDQLPEVIASLERVRKAWRRFRGHP